MSYEIYLKNIFDKFKMTNLKFVFILSLIIN